MKYEAYMAILDTFRRGVEQGVIKENNPVNEVEVEELERSVDNLFKGKSTPFGHGRSPDDLPHWHPNS
jgi:hypothetical protein